MITRWDAVGGVSGYGDITTVTESLDTLEVEARIVRSVDFGKYCAMPTREPIGMRSNLVEGPEDIW